MLVPWWKTCARRDTRMLRLVQTLSNTSAVVEALEEFCKDDLEKQEELAAGKTPLNISDANITATEYVSTKQTVSFGKKCQEIYS